MTPARREGRVARATEAVRRGNRRPELVDALRGARELLPGNEPSGAGDRVSDVVARFLAERGSEPTATREAAIAGVQVWQALSQRVGRGAGAVEATILFTDLVGFSRWVLSAGDEAGLQLLRAVAAVVEPAVTGCGGRIVKRLGDGHMAAFGDPAAGVEAALSIQASLGAVEVEGHRPQLRAGLHRGQPRKLGRDYVGADVNIAARVSAAAGPGEVLVSGAVLEAVDAAALDVRRRRGFRAKGAPKDLEVFAIARGSVG